MSHENSSAKIAMDCVVKIMMKAENQGRTHLIIEEALNSFAEQASRLAYCEGLLDGRDSTTKSWKVADIRSGKETPLSLAKVIGNRSKS